MSLYDDIEMEKTAPSGWSSGLKMMQNQMVFKKSTNAIIKRDVRKNAKLPPVIDLKTKRDDDDTPLQGSAWQSAFSASGLEPQITNNVSIDPEWNFSNEYNPMWPNDYERVVKDMKEKKNKEERNNSFSNNKEDRDNKKFKSTSGFAKRRNSDSEDEDERPRRERSSGAAIAPPAALEEDRLPVYPASANAEALSKFSGGGSIAAKIMAKYGFKEGQGLGKSEQGIVKALEVEKTSKRGGRIVHDSKEESPPPMAAVPPPDEFAPPMAPPPAPKMTDKMEQNISDILKKPSKVAVLRNMVGPGEVDDDLEPEVTEECREKYGPVSQVLIYQMPRVPPEEAVRIFVEFQRIESSIKAVIDLNGRFFGGRQVAAGFYDVDLFKAYKLSEHIG